MSSIEDVQKVDAISLDKETNEVVLNIFDHLDWTDEKSHIALLQDKITNYIKFVESKEIENVFPDAKGKKIKIFILARYNLTGNGIKFIATTTGVVAEAGLSLDHSFLKKLKNDI